MKVAALALVDGVTGKKQEIAWFCAFSEIGSQELHWTKRQNWVENGKEASEQVCLPGNKAALLTG